MRVCECGAPISKRSKTGRCQPCANRFVNNSPEMKAKRAEGIRRKWATDKEFAARMKRQATERIMSPEVREKSRAAFVLNQPWTKASRDAESYARGGRSISEKRLGHIPLTLRGKYRYFVRSKRMSAADATAACLALVDGHYAPQAVDFLRRFASVYRCDEAGAPDSGGSHYRYGNMVKSPKEFVELARRKGWQHDEWKKLAA